MENVQKDYWIGPQFSTIHRDWEMPFLFLRKLPIIVGLTGPTRVGKTMVAKRLVTEHGFHYEKTSTILKEIAAKLGESSHWSKLTEIGEQLRRQWGEDFLARAIIDRIDRKLSESKRFVVDGLIHPADVKLFASRTNFILVGLVASLELRAREASRWYSQTADDILVQLTERDRLENYDHNKLQQYLNGRIKLESCISNNKYAPDIMACFMYVEPEHLIILNDNMGFNQETIFRPIDKIISSI